MKSMKKAAMIVGIALSLFAACPVQAAGDMGDLQPKQVQVKLPSVNSATIQQLQQVPGIGPKKAEKVYQFIQDQGPVSSVKDLEKVKGIGPKTRQQIETKFSAE